MGFLDDAVKSIRGGLNAVNSVSPSIATVLPAQYLNQAEQNRIASEQNLAIARENATLYNPAIAGDPEARKAIMSNPDAMRHLMSGARGQGQGGVGGIQQRLAAAQAANQQEQMLLAPQRQRFEQRLANQALGQAQSPVMQGIADKNLAQQFALAHGSKSANAALASRQAGLATMPGAVNAMSQGASDVQGQFTDLLRQKQGLQGSILGAANQAQQAANKLQESAAARERRISAAPFIAAGTGLASYFGAGGKLPSFGSDSVKPGPSIFTGDIGQAGSFDPSLVAADGGLVPGKAKKAGDHLENDTVKAILSPGEIIIPRSVVNSKNAPEAAKKFVEEVLLKEAKPKKAYAKGGIISAPAYEPAQPVKDPVVTAQPISGPAADSQPIGGGGLPGPSYNVTPYGQAQSAGINWIPLYGQIDPNNANLINWNDPGLMNQAELDALAGQRQAYGQNLAMQAQGLALDPVMQRALQQQNAAQQSIARSQHGADKALLARNVQSNQAMARQAAAAPSQAKAQQNFAQFNAQQQAYGADLTAGSRLANLEEERARQARQAGNDARTGALLGTAGAIAGAYLGGPGGAAAGYQMGSMLGSSFANGGMVKPNLLDTLGKMQYKEQPMSFAEILHAKQLAKRSK